MIVAVALFMFLAEYNLFRSLRKCRSNQIGIFLKTLSKNSETIFLQLFSFGGII